MESNNPSGLKQNVCRYQSLPKDLNSGDIIIYFDIIISTLESKMSGGEKIKDQFKKTRKPVIHLP